MEVNPMLGDTPRTIAEWNIMCFSKAVKARREQGLEYEQAQSILDKWLEYYQLNKDSGTLDEVVENA